MAENHVAQFHGVREQRLFLQFFQRNLYVVVVHGIPRGEISSLILYPVRGQGRELTEEEDRDPPLTPLLPRQEGIHTARSLPRCLRARFRSARLARSAPGTGSLHRPIA